MKSIIALLAIAAVTTLVSCEKPVAHLTVPIYKSDLEAFQASQPE